MQMIKMQRRNLLKATGTLFVHFALTPLSSSNVKAQSSPPKSLLDSWLSIDSRGQVTVFSGKVDLGTGTRTALAQMAADELDVTFESVQMEMGHSHTTPDQGLTGGSLTIMIAGLELRRACATARTALIDIAAKRLGALSSDYDVKQGLIYSRLDPSKSVAYSELLNGQKFSLVVDEKVTLKQPHQFGVIGKSISRVDIPSKVFGTFQYVHDVKFPNMLHARVVRSTIPDARLVGFDDQNCRKVSGFIQSYRVGNFLAVVCKSEWGAVKASNAMKAVWEKSRSLPASGDVFTAWRAKTPSKTVEIQKVGFNANQPLPDGRKIKSRYEFPIQTHASIGPSCAVASFENEILTVWSASQATHSLVDELATVVALPKSQIRVFYVDGSGCYGRNGHEDCSADAALIAKALGKTVRVQWSRKDELANAPKSPPTVAEFEATLDASGKTLAMTADFYVGEHFGPISEYPLLAATEQGISRTTNFIGLHFQNTSIPYAMPNVKVTTHQIRDNIFRSSHLRTPGRLENNFCAESFIDELAENEKADPIEWRRSRLTDPRAIAVIDAVSSLAKWTPRPRLLNAGSTLRSPPRLATGRGFAYVRYNDRQTYVAAIVDVTVDRNSGQVRVDKVFMGHDCGLMINPDGCRNQIEGGVIQTVSRVLIEKLAHDDTEVKSVDWNSYPILRFSATPRVELALIDRPTEPSWGVGEPAPVVIPAAIGNAIFDAIGVRMRTIPFNPQAVSAAMKASFART